MLNKILATWKSDQKRIAVIFNSTHYTYSEIFFISSIVANNLYQQGIRKGSRIALFMNNRPELIYLYFAIFKLGAIAVPINYRYKSVELNTVLQNCQANMLITESEKEQYLTRLSLKIFSISDEFNKNWDNFSLLLDKTTAPHPDIEVREDDLGAILYTSGSTSQPKGVMHSHHTLFAAAQNLIKTINQNETCISGITLPICHIAGMIGQVISTLLVGGKIILFPKFDPVSLVKAIEKHKITHLQMVPINLVELVNYVDQTHADLTSLRCVMVGGDKVPETIQEKFLKLTHCYITEVMGMTESFSYCVNLLQNTKKLGSVGQAAAGGEINIVDKYDHAVKNLEVGEIKIHSQANMIGYWKNRKETIKTLKNGWIYSGDLAYQDQDKFIWFVGRKKQLIIRGGSNISPQEVENVLIQHPSIKETCVVGYPDQNLNQIVCACVVLNNQVALSLQDIKNFCKNLLSDYKTPEKLFIFKKLPRNATGKLDRKKIIATALKLHNQHIQFD